MPEAATALKDPSSDPEPVNVSASMDTDEAVIAQSGITYGTPFQPTSEDWDERVKERESWYEREAERELTDSEKEAIANDPEIAEKYELYGALTFHPDVLTQSKREWIADTTLMLKNAGFTVSGLKAQAEAGRFESCDASWYWGCIEKHVDLLE